MKIKRGDGLNIVPFIDIMLVLLAIVLSVSTFIAQGQIPIEVPKASSSQPSKNEKKIIVVINSQNQIFVDEKPVDFQALKTAFAGISSKDLIELRSDKESKFDTFIQVLNLLKEKNHENFAISTQKD